MKNIKDFIIENQNDIDELIKYIQSILDNNKDLSKDELKPVMDDVRNHMKGYSNYDYMMVERYFKISKAYPNSKTNIEQWIMSKIDDYKK